MQFWAPDDGRKNRLKHVDRLTEINCETLGLAAGSSIGPTLYVQFWAPDDGRKNSLKHVELLQK